AWPLASLNGTDMFYRAQWEPTRQRSSRLARRRLHVPCRKQSCSAGGPVKRAILLFLLIVTASWPPRAESSGKPGGVPVPGSLQLENEEGTTTTLSPEMLAKLPRQQVKARDHGGALVSYEGVALADVLRSAKVTVGKALKGPLLANSLVVEGADGYRVAFSLPEVDPDLTDNMVLLADRKEGKALDDKEGPYRLIVPHDKRPMRWVGQVLRIGV